ncbi:hypothetical protein [Sphingomonas sp. AX6]|uniref:hypothetical protein n=1 Tax=Sphingomonas sp. AX6 TaxID=2653171 RepID=UPI0012EFC3B0|nr:hypothetical protein [Sphingomonas sp. AX6]VXC88668.1 conserved membrane hypothetical protein [Sphingomonas sp. AX6]
MQTGYSLSVNQRRICRLSAALFLLVALTQIVAVAISWTVPGAQYNMRCSDAGCVTTNTPEVGLPDDLRAQMQASPERVQQFERHVRKPHIWAGLGLVNLVQVAPMMALLILVSTAIRRLGRDQSDAMAAALPWIKRASIAALALAIVPPFAAAARVMILMPGTPHGPGIYFSLDGGPLLINLLIAFAAFVVAWALEAGSRAARDVGGFV